MYKKIIFIISFLSVFILFSFNCLALDEDSIITEFFWNKFIKLKPPNRPKIILILGGGGARGFAHIGVLRVFKEEKVPIDGIIGVSVGAIIGSLYASDIPLEKIEKIGENIGWGDITNLSDVRLMRLLVSEKLLSNEKMERYLDEMIGGKRFEDMKIPFICVATDILSGERIILREGNVAQAVRASATIPGIFSPVEYRHRYLVDGGLTGNLPVDIARFMDADFIITVSVSSDFSKHDVSNIYKTLIQSIYIQGSLIDKDNLSKSDFVIKPNVGNISSIDLGRYKECLEAGILAARESIQVLKSRLIEKTSDYFLFN